ncbi:MAG: helix-turn-helix transcriptional regulator [Oscillospiraceae bacterium]
MNTEFPRLLTLLRKEKGISQKQAAGALGVSQALLSHYEKGIRECGLNFLIQCASFYGVSCDYLLGISPDRTGSQLTVDDIPDSETMKDSVFKGNIMPLLSKKLICNSINILFDLVSRSESSQLNAEISSYLMLATYKMYRVIYSANPKNEDAMFSVPVHLVDGYCNAAMTLANCYAEQISHGDGGKNVDKVKNIDEMRITTEFLLENYPKYAQSLLNLIQNSENKMNFSNDNKG